MGIPSVPRMVDSRRHLLGVEVIEVGWSDSVATLLPCYLATLPAPTLTLESSGTDRKAIFGDTQGSEYSCIHA